MRQFWDIQKKFGTRSLKNYPISSIWYHKLYLRYIRRIEMVRPLNYVPYVKEEARRVMADLYGWEAYPQKHFESRFTRSEEHTSELQSLMRISYAVFCLTKKN